MKYLQENVETEAEDEGDANHKASYYVDDNLDKFDWNFDSIKENNTMNK